MKKCPKCIIITGKNNGYNRIACILNADIKPKEDYEIKLMMEGKIKVDKLSQSQRQFED